MIITRRWAWTGVAAAAAAVVAIAYRRRHPAPMPYSERFWIQIPRPLITRTLLLSILGPRPGERILEVGPGIGRYSLPVAQRLSPKGTLDILDIQRQMLDHTMSRARREGLGNIIPTVGDARTLPYPDHAFDAAYLITVLGEIPNRPAALSELHRVVRPGGRVVFGETLADPDWISPQALRREVTAAGFHFDGRTGVRLGYFAHFTRP
jgi:SAM-dependent methyltransferase